MSDQIKAADEIEDKVNQEFDSMIQRLSEKIAEPSCEPRPINISLGQFFVIMLSGFALGFATAVLLTQVLK